MGIIEDIEAMDLADDVKQNMLASARADLAAKDSELTTLRRQSRKDAIEQEVAQLSDALETPLPGLVKHFRRVLLSDDEQPGTVLLTDADLALSGDDAVGATSREEVSTADALRKFVELLPRNAEGKITLSDQALADNAGDPPKKGDDPETGEKDTAGARDRLAKHTGVKIDRKRTRYQGVTG